MSDLITVKEASEILRVTPVHVRRLANAGQITAIRTTPRKTLISRASIEAYINENNSSK